MNLCNTANSGLRETSSLQLPSVETQTESDNNSLGIFKSLYQVNYVSSLGGYPDSNQNFLMRYVQLGV
jgi:hypothetical protein